MNCHKCGKIIYNANDWYAEVRLKATDKDSKPFHLQCVPIAVDKLTIM